MRILFLCFCLLLLPALHFAQTEDIALAKVYLDSARNLTDQDQFKDALEVSLKATKIFEDIIGIEDTLTAKAYFHTGRIFYLQSKYSQASEYYEKALQIQLHKLGEDHLDVTKSYDAIGHINYSKGNFSKALDYHQLALELKIKLIGPKNFTVANSHFNLGKDFKAKGDYIEAYKNYNKALSIRSEILGEDHYTIGHAYNSLGLLCQVQGDYVKALKHLKKSREILLKSRGKDHSDLFPVYLNTGIVYTKIGDYKKAIEYYDKQLSITLKIFGEEHIGVAYNYINRGTVYNKLNNQPEARRHYNRAISIYEKTHGINHPILADCYNNIGNSYRIQKDYDNALKYYNKALELKIKSFGKESEFVAETLTNIGKTWSKKKNYTQALEYFNTAFETTSKTLIRQHPRMSSLYLHLGKLHESSGDKNVAFDYYLKSCQSYGIEWPNPSFNNLGMDWSVLESLEKLTILRPNFQIDSLPDQKHMIELLSDLTTHYSKKFQSGDTRVEFQNQAYYTYETALQLSQNWTPRNKYQEFTFAERSKSTVLLSEVRNAYVEAYRGLPDSLQNKDYDLKLDIAQHEKQRFRVEQKGVTKYDSIIRVYNSKIFDLKRKQEALFNTFQQDYPDYYQLKYDNSTASVEEIQNLLSKDQALIEYFVGDSSVFIFSLTPTEYEVTTIKKDFPLEEWVSQVRDGVYLYKPGGALSKMQSDSLVQQYVKAAHGLYQQLIAPIPLDLPKRLIIIPDGALSYLPFDVLLKSKPDNPYRFKTYDYLLKDHAVSYNYSATLYQQILAKKHPKGRKAMLAIAPHFGEENTDLILANRSIEELRDTLLPLYFTLPEVAYLHDQFDADTLTGNHAILPRFQQLAKDYRIVHLSTHGKANDQIGDYSYLAFTEIPDSIENEKLYARELYNLELNADMVVLSACETGLGELKRGEGIIGMTRGFTYAGAKSIITTLWSVNDKSTQEFMQYFYDGLKEGLPKDVAIQQAKLALLQRNYPEPFYWAAFTPIGDMEPLDLGSGWKGWYVLGIFGIAGLLGWFWQQRGRKIMA